MAIIDITDRLSPRTRKPAAPNSADSALRAFCRESNKGLDEVATIQTEPGHPLAGPFLAWTRAARARWARLHGAQGRRPTAADPTAFERWLDAGAPSHFKPKAIE